MSQGDRLTRQELAWLLTQEARSAARTLRKGVAVLSHSPEITDATSPEPKERIDVTSSLDALDDATRMLVSLHSGSGTRGRRGRLDLAALLCELAPNARVRIAPGSGTEVFGEEMELRRMLQVLLAQTGSAQTAAVSEHPEVSIERAGNEIRVTVTLGPDTSTTSGAEHAWLSRMAMKYGGRLQLEGGQESLTFPAEGAMERSEVEALRKELAEAQRQGEAYARELAAVFAAGETTPLAPSTIPPASGNLTTLLGFANCISAELRGVVSAMTKELDQLSQRGADPGVNSEAMQRHVARLGELTHELGRFARIQPEELPAPTDVRRTARELIDETSARAHRCGVQVADEGDAAAHVVIRPTALRALMRALLDHAIEACARDGTVTMRTQADDRDLVVTVDDTGASVPAGAREPLLWRRIDPASLGRPVGPHLLMAATIVAHLNGKLELDDAPSGGNRTRAVLPVL